MNKTIDKKVRDRSQLCREEGYSFVCAVVKHGEGETLENINGDTACILAGISGFVKTLSENTGESVGQITKLIRAGARLVETGRNK